MKKIKEKIIPPKDIPHSDYHRIWRMVDGSIRTVMMEHPDYFSGKKPKAMRMSLTKRIAGQLAAVLREKARIEKIDG
jgi:hypothetical protein